MHQLYFDLSYLDSGIQIEPQSKKRQTYFFFFKNTLAKTSEGVKRSLFKKTYSRQSSIQLSEEKLFYPDSNGKNRALQLL